MLSSLVGWIMYGYYREKLHVNHLWGLKGLFSRESVAARGDN